MKIFTLPVIFAVIVFAAGCKSSSEIADSNKSLRTDGGNNGFSSNKISNSNNDYLSNGSNSDNNSYSSNNSNSSSNGSLSPPVSSNGNSVLPASSPTGKSVSMPAEEKYKLFYAASKSGDGPLVLEVSRKIGINDADNRPTPAYVNFWKGYIDWTSKDKSFAKTLDTPEKAKNYVNSRLQ